MGSGTTVAFVASKQNVLVLSSDLKLAAANCVCPDPQMYYSFRSFPTSTFTILFLPVMNVHRSVRSSMTDSLTCKTSMVQSAYDMAIENDDLHWHIFQMCFIVSYV